MENLSDGIVIESVVEYLEIISSIRRRNLSDEDASIDRQKYFFRGQENSSWDIRPNVFRDGLLTVEATSAQAAYSRNPSEFANLKTPFERLTKLQHYGLCTRLLDVTLNPLVALYFASLPSYDLQNSDGDTCSPADIDVKRIVRDGVVFFRRSYAIGTNNLATRVISLLAETELGANTTLLSVADILRDSNSFTTKELRSLFESDFRLLCDIIQSNYFVTSNFTNERLIRQNGAFLIPGCFSITSNNSDIESITIQKAAKGLQGEFDNEFFVIVADSKEEILDELNLYNVNEASLFPELEHQMRYIRQDHFKYADPTSVSVFSKTTSIFEDSTTKPKDQYGANIELSNQEILGVAREIITPGLKQKQIIEQIVDIIKNNLVIDWYKKTSVVSKIKVEITRFLAAQGRFTSESAARFADEFIKQFGDKLGIELEQ